MQRYLPLILSGQKTIEGRLAKGRFLAIKPGHIIEFNGSGQDFKVIGVRKYLTFKEMLENEGLNRVVPGVNSLGEAEKLYHSIYPPPQMKGNMRY
ncbi:MAG: ASCH domain-containing protein [Thermosipho sp. (in: Bacteria)]|nr:ASCH domain-containing protein [Thermosipho sp. (in: thermotogales)]